MESERIMSENIDEIETDFGWLSCPVARFVEPHLPRTMFSKIDVNMGGKSIDFFSGNLYVTVIHSTCPNCDHVNEWSTTGMLPGHITCKKCDEKFNVKMP